MLYNVTADFWPGNRGPGQVKEQIERTIEARDDLEAASLMREHLNKEGQCAVSNVSPVPREAG